MTSFKTTSQKAPWPALSSSSYWLQKEEAALSLDSNPNTVSFQGEERGEKERGRVMDSYLAQVASITLRSLLSGSILVLKFHSDLHVSVMIMAL